MPLHLTVLILSGKVWPGVERWFCFGGRLCVVFVPIEAPFT